MNEINDNSKLFNVKSNLDWPVNFVNAVSTSYDVYSVYEVEKHYLWCLGDVQKRLKNLASLLANLGREKPKTVQYQAVTSYDVFADYQANLHNQAGGESTLEKLGLVFCFGASILLVYFSVLVVF